MSQPGAGPGAASADAATVRELVGRSTSAVADLQRRLKEEQQIQRFLVGLADSLGDGHASEALRQLASGQKQLELLAVRERPVADQLRRMESALRTQVQELFQELAHNFPVEIQRAGIRLDPGSRHPRYTVLDGLIEIKFDKSRLESHVLPRDGRRATLGIDVHRLVTHLVAEVDRLTGRSFDSRAFLHSLTSAYGAVLASSTKADGTSVPLKEVVAELAKAKGFRADEFNVDLSRFVRDEASSGRIWLENARDPKNGLLLWQLDQRGYYGYIRMEDGGDDTARS